MADIGTLPTPGQRPWSLNPAITAMNNELEGRLGASTLSATIAGGSRTVVAAGMDASGTADSTAAFLEAVAATPADHTLVMPNIGANYRIASSLVIPVTGPLDIDFRKARFNNGRSSGYLMSFVGAFDTPVAISALSTVTIPASTDNWTSNDTVGLQFTTASAQSWERGDVVKVYSDDVIPEGRVTDVPGSDARMGQFLRVHSVSGTTVTMTGLLEELSVYTTNIKAARLPSHPVTLRGLDPSMTSASLASPGSRQGILLKSLIRPHVQSVNVERTAGAAITVHSCVDAVIENVNVGLARDDQANGVFGYGVLDIGSDGTVVHNLRAKKVRHAYTDDAVRTTVNAAPENYGRPRNAVVNGHAEKTSATAFDTHGFGENATFDGCTAVDVPVGVSLRGRKHKVNDLTVTNAKIAVQVASEPDSVDSWGHMIDGVKAVNISDSVVSFYLRYGTHPQVDVMETRKSFVSNVTATESAGKLFYAYNATVERHNMSLTTGTTLNTSTPGIVRTINSDVDAAVTRIDLRKLASMSGVTVFYNTLNSLQESDYRVRWASTGVAPTTLVDSSGTGNAVCFTGGKLSDPLPSSFLAGGIVSWTVPVGLTSNVFGRNAGYFAGTHTTIAANANMVPAIADIDCPSIVFIITATSTANFASIPNGRRQGQGLAILNSTSSTAAITLKHGDASFNTTLTGGTDKVLAAGDWLYLVWAGVTWLQV